MDNPMHYSEDTTMRQDDRVTSVTFTLPAGHKWTSVEAAMKEAHDREYELRMAFFWECQRLQAEVERLRKAGDAVALDYAERIEIEAGDTAKNLMRKVPVLRDWTAAKEGKPSV